MTISVGDKIPETTLFIMGADGPEANSTSDLFGDKKIALFGLPGAFTPTCSAKHVPGFVENASALAEKGIDKIICVSVNDVFVMDAWGKDQGAGDAVVMASDGSADLAKAMGLDFDLSARGFGLRCKRFAMVVNDGVVESIDLEDDGGYEVTSAQHMLANL